MANDDLKFASNLDSTLDKKLDSTEHKLRDIVSLIHKNSKDFAKQLGNNEITEVKVEEIGEGKGFNSIVFQVKVTYGDSTSIFIAKVSTDKQWKKLTSDEAEIDKESSKDLIIEMHNCECDAYELLKRLENLPVPYAYFTEKASKTSPGLILMEDVSKKGKSMEIFETVPLEIVYKVTRLIAEFQAQAEFMEDQSWRKKLALIVQATDIVDSVVQGLMMPALECDDKELKENVQMYVDFDLKELAKFTLGTFSGESDANMLCHGDMWTNNLLIETKPDGSMTNNIGSIIDWQIACVANPLFDVCSFLILCADEKERRENERKVIDFYYDELCKLYSKHDAKPKFTREQAHEFYDVAFVQPVISLIMKFSVHIVSRDDSKNEKEKKGLIERLRAAFQDAQPILEKYELKKRFTSNKKQ